MNVGSFGSPAIMNRVPILSKRTSSGFGEELGFKMNGTSTPKTDMSNEFWNILYKLPKKDQMTTAAAALMGKMNTNSDNSNSSFIKEFKDRFSAAELSSIKTLLKENPQMKGKSEKEVNDFLKYLDGMWKNNSLEAQETPTFGKEGIPFRSPETIFFQTSFLNKRPTGVTPVPTL
ncbi:MAG: hypothetical protein HQM08_07290 [Candidatus Riflebacteria bacterium]|nr:hypothetical protein [Candidatus Riflebacteria bacterium]